MTRDATKETYFLDRHGERTIIKGSVGACGNLFFLPVEEKGYASARDGLSSLLIEQYGSSRTRRAPATAFPTCQTKETRIVI